MDDVESIQFELPSLSVKIGEGTSSVVYLHKLQNKQSAVKILKQPVSMRKMKKISKKLHKIDSIFIVKFLGYCVNPSALLYEYCSAMVHDEIVTNLAQYLDILNDENEFDFRHRCDILKQSAHGLAYLHANNITHRDFKPSNLMVEGNSGNLKVKLGDFDDSYTLKTTINTLQTNLQGMKGTTLAYTAPEICNGTATTTSENTDIYSWGMSAFQIMAGLSTPWTKTLPILNDTLILQALQQGRRPPSKLLDNLYHKDMVTEIYSLIQNTWTEKPERPKVIEVSLYLTFWYCQSY